MKFLPIVIRELTVAARRKATHWTRMLSATVAVAITAWMLSVMAGSFPQETSKAIFGVMTAMMTLYCAMAGVRFTADCLSAERREGTLGLLFLTNLRGHDVVLGKLVASSLDAFYGALAIVPVLGLPLLMGGVTLGEFGRMSLVALNALFFSLACGMLVSTVARSAHVAAWGTLLVLILVAGGLPALDAYLVGKDPTSRSVFPWGYILCPGYTYALGFDALYRRSAWQFWTSLGATHALAWVLLGFASLILPRMWQDRPSSSGRGGVGHRIQLWLRGNSPSDARFRRKLLDRNAYYWLTSRRHWKPAVAWFALVVMAAIWAWGWHRFKSDWTNEGTYFMTGIILNFIIRVAFASEASRQLAEDHHNGALELLLSTPLTVSEILRGQYLSLRRIFLGPLVFILLIETVLFIATIKTQYGSDRSMWICLWLGMIVMTLIDLGALFWVSQWMGLTARQPNRASANSLALVFFPPWALLALIGMASVTSHTGGGWETFFSMWCLFGLINDFVVGAWAQMKLREEFRTAAQRRYAPQKGLLEILAGK